ncbi:hypothetical protein I204_07636 [Kwoniella mangroviensis CBS 8886]|nr:hypothetical protein I204_07636 [Kwoniella mangroviensis CBS 8886]
MKGLTKIFGKKGKGSSSRSSTMGSSIASSSRQSTISQSRSIRGPPPSYTSLGSEAPTLSQEPYRELYPYPIFAADHHTEAIDVRTIDLTAPPKGGHWQHAGDMTHANAGNVVEGISNIIRSGAVSWDTSVGTDTVNKFEVLPFNFYELKGSMKEYTDSHMQVAKDLMPRFRTEAAKLWQSDPSSVNPSLTKDERRIKWKEVLDSYAGACKQICDANPEVTWRKQKALGHWLAFAIDEKPLDMVSDTDVESATDPISPQQFDIEAATALNHLLRDMNTPEDLHAFSQDPFSSLEDSLTGEWTGLKGRFPNIEHSNDPEARKALASFEERKILLHKLLSENEE